MNDTSFRFIVPVFYKWSTYTLLFIASLAACLNFFVVVSARWVRRAFSANLRLTMSLGVADLWAAILFAMGLIFNSLLPFVAGIHLPQLNCFRVFLESLRLSGFLTSVYHLLILSANQGYSIFCPIRHRALVTPCMVKIIIVFLWIVPALILNVYLGSLPEEGYHVEGCTTRKMFAFDFRLAIFLSILTPFVAILGCYIYIVAKISDGRRLVSNQLPTKVTRKKLIALKTTLCLVGSFLIGWLPAVVAYALVCENCPFQISDRSTVMYVGFATNFLMALKLAADPLIYAFKVPEIRVAIWLMLNSRCGYYSEAAVLPFLPDRLKSRISPSVVISIMK